MVSSWKLVPTTLLQDQTGGIFNADADADADIDPDADADAANWPILTLACFP